MPLVEVERLTKVFPLASRGWKGRAGEVVAVHEVAFTLMRGESLAIVGESGSGKTTIARMLVGLERPTSGAIRFQGNDRSTPAPKSAERRRRGREIQIVFQDPYSSLDPRQRVVDALDETLRLHFRQSPAERRRRVSDLLDQVALGMRERQSLPRRLSGGQRQRVAIARALATEPSVLVLDEAVSALDVSIQAQILNLLADIQHATGIAYIVISHDLAVVRHLTQSALVMYRGSVVERGATDEVMREPDHPYTKLLLDSVPRGGWRPQFRTSSESVDSGCLFRPRCPDAHDACGEAPPLVSCGARASRCWLVHPPRPASREPALTEISSSREPPPKSPS